MATPFEKFTLVLKDLFMLDQADLDFGIYRIINQKRNEIERFLEKDLKIQVQALLKEFDNSDTEAVQKELKQLTATLLGAGMNPDDSPKVQELRKKLAAATNPSDMEADVYSHLATFFNRYYDSGDFMSIRRYKKDVYAIPYEGEEVKLHWANADQYYIKTTENFQNYTFITTDGKTVHFRLRDASTELNNNKVQSDQVRRFVIAEEEVYEVNGDELCIFFTYELNPISQKDLSEKAASVLINKLQSEADLLPFQTGLLSKAPTEKNKTRTLLEKHLNDYVSKNSFDYFIHKDLSGFLRRELDFYIKNEVLFIDDISTRSPEEFVAYLTQVKTIKAVGDKLITFLAQLEDFQKKLWLKKKFVVETNYCITLDRVPEELYNEIVKNESQRKEWVSLFAIDEIEGSVGNDMFNSGTVGYSEPLSIDFLKQNPYLVLDTAFFDEKFKQQLISSIDNFEDQLDGTLINSENFQALNILQEKYNETIRIQYIDPPFNLNSNADYAYSTNYKDSTWLTLLQNRIQLCKKLLNSNSLFFVRCDYHGNHFVRYILDGFELDYKSEILLSRSRNEAGSTKMDVTHEFLYLYSKKDYDIEKYKINRSVADIKWTGFLMAGERNPPERNFMGVIIYPPKGQHFSLIQQKVDKLLKEFHLRLKCKSCGALYYNAESTESLTKKMKSKKEKFKFYDISTNTVFYGVENLDNCCDCNSKEFVVQYLGAPEEYINDNWLDISSYSRSWDFKTENSEELLERVILFSNEKDFVIDYFSGSGTTIATAHKMNRKWIGVEMGEYFDTSILKRMKNVISGEKSGISSKYSIKNSGCFKYIRLEQYEDTLNNLIIQKPDTLFDSSRSFDEGYLLGYMMEIETRGSLFNLKWFVNPFDVVMKITKQNELKETKIDLVETFNYLIGLNVYNTSYPKDGLCVVEGTTRNGEKSLVIWRDCTKIDSEAINDFFIRSAYSTLDHEYDRIYINGDNMLQNIRKDEDHWKVVLVEEEFSKRMFEA